MGQCKEFQAIVLAGGKGSRMTELTAGRPKCLLPVGNMPMIWYPLSVLEKSGFTDVIVIVSESMKNEVAPCLDKLGLDIKLDIIGIPGGEDMGTADSIRFIHEKIHLDCVVISCDLIMDVDMSELLNLYRKHNASITALMLPVPKVPESFVVPGPKSKQKPEIDLIGVDNKTNRLIFLASASDFEDTVTLSRKLLKKHTSFTIHSKLLDAHLYILNKWVLDFLVFNKNFSTLKGELLPYIVSKQLSHPPKQTIDDKNTSLVQLDTKDDIFRFAVEKPLDALIQKMSAYNDHYTDFEEAYNGDVIRCYVHTVTDKFGLRANTVQMYTLANAMISDWDGSGTITGIFPLPTISSSANVKSTQVQNCRIDENAFVDEKTSLKLSHIGPNTTIESKTRVSQSILMGNVTIKQRCVIHNCIVCNGTVIEEGSELKDCLIGAHHVIPAGSQHNRDVLTDLDKLMEI
ncbi:translation initiation factor eIF-2B subunit gamma [Orussus abietinus]|uniref:translation initiation factor eIF-2B subunit gamma n=1 Tax=Orussus abietinus TaxID=222816 RepID=UPI000626BA2B|nr:translation initiation factor eIF-2B subunit gamma [Orussus abietinus]